jgi:hypothetical protein
MHPLPSSSVMTRLASGVSLGLLISAAPLGLSVFLPSDADGVLPVAARPDDDRGSGRCTRAPAVADRVSLRGSGRVDPRPPTAGLDRHSPVAYRGSGRITQPRTT